VPKVQSEYKPEPVTYNGQFAIHNP